MKKTNWTTEINEYANKHWDKKIHKVYKPALRAFLNAMSAAVADAALGQYEIDAKGIISEGLLRADKKGFNAAYDCQTEWKAALEIWASSSTFQLIIKI